MPPNTPSNAHGFAMRSMSLRDMQIPKSEKKFLGPPLPNPGDAPVYRIVYAVFAMSFEIVYTICVECNHMLKRTKSAQM